MKNKTKTLKQSEKLFYMVLTVDDKTSLKEISKNLQHIDIIEIRIDKFRNLKVPYVIQHVSRIKNLGKPVILTIRSKSEGGVGNVDDKLRYDLFSALVEYCDYIDIELSSAKIIKSVVKLAWQNSIKLIVSYHNFSETPVNSKLEKILKDSKKTGADIVKIAVMPKSNADLKQLLKFSVEHDKDRKIIIAMGKSGKVSRIFFPLAGSVFTYTYLGNKDIAPGQIPLEMMIILKKIFY